MNRLSLPALRSPAYTFILEYQPPKTWGSEFLSLKPSGLRHLLTVALATRCLCSPRSSTQRNTTVSQTQNNMELNTTQNRVSQTQYNTEPDTQDTNLFSSKGKFMYHGHKLKIKVLLLPSTIQRLLSRACRRLLHGNQGVFVLSGGVFPPLQELENKGPGECLLTWFILITPILPPQNEAGFWKQPLPLRGTLKPTSKSW